MSADMDVSSLLWDEATRDMDSERAELARTAALADADRMLGPLVFQAATAEDLGHRLALAEPHLWAISQRRGYPVQDLEADLTRQWELMAEARNQAAAATAAAEAARREQRQVTAAREVVMDQAVARLAARAARENPMVPMRECLRLATEAVRKHADAFPLAYDSWGGTADGPFTERAKNWKPPKGGVTAPSRSDDAAAAPEPPGAPGHLRPEFSDPATPHVSPPNPGRAPEPATFNNSEEPSAARRVGPGATVPGGFSDPAGPDSPSGARPPVPTGFSDPPNGPGSGPQQLPLPTDPNPTFSDPPRPDTPPPGRRGRPSDNFSDW